MTRNSTENRICSPLTECTPNEYISKKKTETSNRECSSCQGKGPDCIGCMLKEDCAYNPLSRISDASECSSKICRVFVPGDPYPSTENDKPILKKNDWLRFEGENLVTNAKIYSGTGFKYLQISDVSETISFEGQELFVQKDCVWGEYVNASVGGTGMECSTNYGPGTTTAFRPDVPIRQATKYGKKCNDFPEIIQIPCVGKYKPIDCTWEPWPRNKWTECQAACGKSGFKYQNVTFVQPKNKGKECPKLNKTTCIGPPKSGHCDCIGRRNDVCDVCGGDGSTCIGCDGQNYKDSLENKKIWKCDRCVHPQTKCNNAGKMRLKQSRQKYRSTVIQIALPSVFGLLLAVGFGVGLFLYLANLPEEDRTKRKIFLS